jgi:bifunctional non-homologous end joining protein LigD
MKPLVQDKSPFDDESPQYENTTWLKPLLVGQFRFTEWTKDDKLRHSSFLGLRDDKKALQVIRG